MVAIPLSPPVGATCEEASPQSHQHYIACGQPALFVVRQANGEQYNMCAPCADHNIKNRGAAYVMRGEKDGASIFPKFDVGVPMPSIVEYADNDPLSGTDDDFQASALPGDNSIKSIAFLAEEQRSAEVEVERLTELLQAAIKRLAEIRDSSLPMALANAGTKGITLVDGTPVSVRTKYDGRKLIDPAGLRWVEDNGGAPIIKTTIVIELDRGKIEDARGLVDELRHHRMAPEFKTVNLEESVHSSTIASWVRQKIEAGGDPPLDTLGVNRRTFAVLGKSPPTSVDLKGLTRKK